MNEQFWCLNPPRSLRKLADWDHDRMKLDSVVCPLSENHRRGGRRLTDLSIVLPDGEVEDVVWTWQTDCLVQSHVVKLLRGSGFSGFELKPVTARFRRSGTAPPELWELVVTGWAGMAAPESGVKRDDSKSCDVCGHVVYTGTRHPERLIDASKWDGSDFFIVWPLPRFIFISNRAAQTIREHHLTGARIVRPSELGELNGFTPGPLSYRMSEERAHALGGPLGIH